jgi:hypothetical protein
VLLYLDGRRRDTDRPFDRDLFKKDCKAHIAPVLQSISLLLDRAERPLSRVLASSGSSHALSLSSSITASSLLSSDDDTSSGHASFSRRDHAPNVFLRNVVRKFENLIL